MATNEYESTSENNTEQILAKIEKIHLEKRIKYILQYRALTSKPLDETWLRQQDKKIIAGIYFDTVKKIEKDKTEALNACLKIIKRYNITKTQLKEYLYYGYDLYNKENDLTDEEGRNLTDGERLERLLDKQKQINYVLEILKLYPDIISLIGQKNERKR